MDRSDARPPVSLADARERAVNALSVHFANDAITLEELERRIELAYRATNAVELEALTSDLVVARVPAVQPAPAVPPPARVPRAALDLPIHDRVVAIMSETHRQGAWPVPQQLETLIVMGNTRIDLTQSVLPPVMEIHVSCLMGALEVRVPPGVHVLNHVGAFMGNVSVELETPGRVPSDAPVVRLSGWTCMGEVKVRER